MSYCVFLPSLHSNTTVNSLLHLLRKNGVPEEKVCSISITPNQRNPSNYNARVFLKSPLAALKVMNCRTRSNSKHPALRPENTAQCRIQFCRLTASRGIVVMDELSAQLFLVNGQLLIDWEEQQDGLEWRIQIGPKHVKFAKWFPRHDHVEVQFNMKFEPSVKRLINRGNPKFKRWTCTDCTYHNLYEYPNCILCYGKGPDLDSSDEYHSDNSENEKEYNFQNPRPSRWMPVASYFEGAEDNEDHLACCDINCKRRACLIGHSSILRVKIRSNKQLTHLANRQVEELRSMPMQQNVQCLQCKYVFQNSHQCLMHIYSCHSYQHILMSQLSKIWSIRRKALRDVVPPNLDSIKLFENYMKTIRMKSWKTAFALASVILAFPPEWAPEDLSEDFYKTIYKVLDQEREKNAFKAMFSITHDSPRKRNMRVCKYYILGTCMANPCRFYHPPRGTELDPRSYRLIDLEDAPMVDPVVAFLQRVEDARRPPRGPCSVCGKPHEPLYDLYCSTTPCRWIGDLREDRGCELQRGLKYMGERVIVQFRDETLKAFPWSSPAAKQEMCKTLVRGFNLCGLPCDIYTFSDKQIKMDSRSATFVVSTLADSSNDCIFWMWDNDETRPGKNAARRSLLCSTTCSSIEVPMRCIKEIDDIIMCYPGYDRKVHGAFDRKRHGKPDAFYCRTNGAGFVNRKKSMDFCGRTDVTGATMRVRGGGVKGNFMFIDPEVWNLDPNVWFWVRPSQVKFESPLNTAAICDQLKLIPCYLNSPLITILLSRGVPKEVIIGKIKMHISRLNKIAEFFTTENPTDECKDAICEYLWWTNKVRFNAKINKVKVPILLDRILDGHVERIRDQVRRVFNLEARNMVNDFRIRMDRPSARIKVLPDPTGILKEGEVFLKVPAVMHEWDCANCSTTNHRYRHRCSKCRRPRKIEYQVIRDRKIMYYKDPMLFPDALRIGKAIYCEKLDAQAHGTALIFSIHADSSWMQIDFDGDEVWVSVDEDIMPTKQMPPLRIIEPKAAEATRPDSYLGWKIAFMRHYMQFKDTIGLMSKAHMRWCDHFEKEGMANNPVCRDIAKRHFFQINANKKGVVIPFPKELHCHKIPKYDQPHFNLDTTNTCTKDEIKEVLVRWKADHDRNSHQVIRSNHRNDRRLTGNRMPNRMPNGPNGMRGPQNGHGAPNGHGPGPGPGGPPHMNGPPRNPQRPPFDGSQPPFKPQPQANTPATMPPLPTPSGSMPGIGSAGPGPRDANRSSHQNRGPGLAFPHPQTDGPPSQMSHGHDPLARPQQPPGPDHGHGPGPSSSGGPSNHPGHQNGFGPPRHLGVSPGPPSGLAGPPGVGMGMGSSNGPGPQGPGPGPPTSSISNAPPGLTKPNPPGPPHTETVGYGNPNPNAPPFDPHQMSPYKDSHFAPYRDQMQQLDLGPDLERRPAPNSGTQHNPQFSMG